MTARITRISPEQLHKTPGYHHVTVVESGRTAYLAGQCPLDRNGSLVGPDSVERQVDQVVVNALAVLGAVQAQPQHVVRSVIYVRSDDADVLTIVWRRFNSSALGPAFASASTLLGVAQLGFTGQLVEVDLIVALPH
ncbi:RidA family protein [Streptomyces sp. NPDC048295]|uniref:RidA family protein n=1 Tax=Streptomyces sp. NPDC048295 TaxID=3154617 RepID=UPI00342367AB